MMDMLEVVAEQENATAITHGGVFHADEVFASVILAKAKGFVKLLRTFKVPDELSEDVVVFDIGGGKFDHHQKGGNGARENGVPYAAAGLIWQAFGREVVKDSCNPEKVWSIIDRDLIQGVDAIDNGVMPKADYPTSAMTISHVISGFNPNWDSDTDPDEAFMKAVELAEQVFENCLASAEAVAKAEDIFNEALAKSDGTILVLDQYIPWDEALFASKDEKAASLLYVITPSNRGGYNCQCVPDKLGSFGQRKGLPEAWRGLRDKDLQEKTGIATAIFCHPAGFIGGADTLEDTVKFAKLAVEA